MFNRIINKIPRNNVFGNFKISQPISTLRQYPVIGKIGLVEAVICETGNDEGEKEHPDDYSKRALSDLSKAVPKTMESQDILVAKINQSVVDYPEWIEKKQVKAKYIGHVTVFLACVRDGQIDPYKDLIVSKVPRLEPFQEGDDVLENGLATSKSKYKRGLNNNSTEYFSFILLSKTSLTIPLFRERFLRIKNRKEPYELINSACGQAVYEVLTGKEGEPKASSQTAFIQAVIGILKDDDEHFYRNFKKAFAESKLDKKADELGKELHEKSIENQVRNKPTSFKRT